MSEVGKDLAAMDLLTAFDDTAYCLDKALVCARKLGQGRSNGALRQNIREMRANVERQRLTLRGDAEGDWKKYWPEPGVWPNKSPDPSDDAIILKS